MNIVALDPSLVSFGWACEFDRVVSCGTIKPGKRRGMERIDFILAELNESFGFGDSIGDLFVLEGYSYGSRGRAAVSLGELGGVLRHELHKNRVPFVEVSPNGRAKLATGKGNAAKEAVLVEAVRRLNYAGSSHDEADALWLLEAARQHYKRSVIALPKKHLEALEAINFPTRETIGGAP